MRFSLTNTSTALFGLALSMSSAQASPVAGSNMLSRATTPSASPLCTNFKAACTTQCGTQQTKSTCVEKPNGKLPVLNCRCGKGLLADKTAEVLLRMALTCAAKPVVVEPVITYGPNLLKNPGFEPDLTSWETLNCESSPGGRTNKDGDTAKA